MVVFCPKRLSAGSRSSSAELDGAAVHGKALEMILRGLKIFFTALPFLLSFLRDYRRFVFFGAGRQVNDGFHEKRARDLTARIAALGPSFIKLTQVISTRADIIPPLYLRELSRLHDEVPPVSFAVVKKVVEEEYRRPLGEVFDDFDPTPLAAASLGQVHKAKYRGEEVAVKVQRPGIHHLVTIDLKIINRILSVLNHLFQSYQLRSLQVVIDEFSRTIYEEMDFEHEALNIRRFQELMKDRPALCVPEYFPELTTPRILVMRYYHGIKITEFEKLKAQGINVDRVLSKLIEVYTQQILLDGVIHADPHPGNILVTAEEKIVLLDYGLVVELDAETRKELIQTTLAGARRDFDRLVEGYYNLGIANREVSPAVLREAAETMFDILTMEGMTQKRIQEIAIEILESFYAFPFELPSNLVYLFKTAALVEGIGTLYRNDFNAVKDIVPLARQVLREEKAASVCQQGKTELENLQRMYRDAAGLLKALRREELRVRIHPVTISQTERYVARIFRRSILGLMAMTLAITSGLLYLADGNSYLLAGGLTLSGGILIGLILIPIPSTYGFHLWMDLGRKKRKSNGRVPSSVPPRKKGKTGGG
ncbi:MAG: AarF/ABC1/UbiB kinase family protein [Deltaproteobacteria bacterium]|nr:AarF/ABC1/UbiB kinase family protein [Deltaproteobacteria bacterium]